MIIKLKFHINSQLLFKSNSWKCICKLRNSFSHFLFFYYLRLQEELFKIQYLKYTQILS